MLVPALGLGFLAICISYVPNASTVGPIAEASRGASDCPCLPQAAGNELFGHGGLRPSSTSEPISRLRLVAVCVRPRSAVTNNLVRLALSQVRVVTGETYKAAKMGTAPGSCNTAPASGATSTRRSAAGPGTSRSWSQAPRSAGPRAVTFPRTPAPSSSPGSETRP